MACIMQGQRLGLAIFNPRTSHLQATETWEDASSQDFPCLQLLKFQSPPILIYTSTKSDESFMAALKQPVSEGGKEFEVKQVKSSIFSLAQAKHSSTLITRSKLELRGA
eukprot:TRINITY_DN38407_c0_g1_i1.p1 TRINITY_DN38407_c0_g1~~TRINITY_DN38407_c0_g1_i1.p1  ORF type:complete len:109 (+),score=13.49 TRINITY_DN38407_c0_g1_i1:349-675(+)